MSKRTIVGDPCKSCTHTIRYIRDGSCVACRKSKALKRYAENRHNETFKRKCSDNLRRYRNSLEGSAKVKNFPSRSKNSRSNEYQKINKNILRIKEVIKTYNITEEEEYLLLIKEQNNTCKLCGGPPGKKHLALDHCHNTGKVRALLCHKCNLGLGLFRDDVQMLEKAIEYLKTYG